MFPARLFVILVSLAAICAAQQGAPAPSTASCNLEDGRQVYIRYNPVSSKGERVSNGKPFIPGGSPMTLFTDVPLTLGNSMIPIGAYTVYPIPGKDKWTLAVNKNVTAGAPYDDKQDIARAAMDTAQITQPLDTLDVAFAHVGPRCTLRIYFGKSASFVDFTAK